MFAASEDSPGDLVRAALARLDRPLEIALVVGRRVLAGEVDRALGLAGVTVVAGVLAGLEGGVGAARPRVRRPSGRSRRDRRTRRRSPRSRCAGAAERLVRLRVTSALSAGPWARSASSPPAPERPPKYVVRMLRRPGSPRVLSQVTQIGVVGVHVAVPPAVVAAAGARTASAASRSSPCRARRCSAACGAQPGALESTRRRVVNGIASTTRSATTSAGAPANRSP